MPKYLQPANRRGGSISQQLLAKTWQFPSLFPEGPHFCSHLFKVKGAVKNFKMLSGSFPIFVLSNHITFCQTQTGATVPLREVGGRENDDGKRELMVVVRSDSFR
jgi:hypothetical protein